MSDKRRQLIQSLLEAMGAARGAFQHGHGPMFARHGIGMPHFKLMLKLSGDKGVSVSELAEAAHVTPGAITQFADHLVAKGLVERFEDPADRRSVRLRLTTKAKQHIAQMKKFHFDRMTKMFKNLDDTELEQLAALVNKVEATHDEENCHHHWHQGAPRES